MKGIILIALLISLGLSVTVTEDSKCNACTEFKSQADCENKDHGLGCEWKEPACAKKITPPAETFKSYCESLEDPGTKCSKTFGCAYVDGKCTHFTGCTAYVKTTVVECQNISYKCLTNGTTCDNVLECTEYTAENCEASPALSSPFKCKLDNGACRALNCAEAETSTQNCAAWKSGCISNGYGCVDSLSNCSQYTGNADSCLKMIGSDGKCSFDTTTTDKCKLRVCSELKLSTYDDASCKAYKGTCISTGFSCADSLSSCTAYDGNATTCLTYIGSTGFCAADANTTKCRDRKCEDLKSGVLTECQTYLGTCLTNGVTCVTTLQKCAQYTGKKSECLKITGSDGKCKGTSDTDSNAACVLKTCAEDDLNNETTDAACGLVQFGCKSTGVGCIDRLASCTSYTDDGNCLKLIGSEGKCKAGTGGKCAAKVCTDNTTATTNAACDEFKTGCVTSGAGCIGQSSCKDTVKQVTCDATFESSLKCGWYNVCISSTSCTAFITQSLCLNSKVGNQPCFWDNGCRLALCSDYTSTDSTVCNTYKPGCISNGTKCANPMNCETEFTGTKATCEEYKPYCTNDEAALATAACKSKSCADTTITATLDSDCETYLSGCLFAGTNKCILNTAPCSSYQGTIEVCNTFTGYVSSTAPRVKCSSDDGVTCATRYCHHATGMTSNNDCNTFLDGCLYNGDASCVSLSAGCSSYKYITNADECRVFKGDSGATLCYDGSGNSCKDKSCSDETSLDVDSDTECANFMSTCVYDGKAGTRCVPNTNNCDLFEGTSEQCNGLTRNEKQCTRRESCKTRVCAEKTDANSNGDCITYHSSCRLTHGSNTCVGAKAACTSYTLVAAKTDQQTYCNVVTEDDGGQCSYDTATTANCVARACKFWVSSLASSVSCVNYLGKDTCVLANTDYCYAVGACTSYSIPTSVTTGQAAWCFNLKSSDGLKCTHVSGGNCAVISTCEDIVSATDGVDCQLQSGLGNCIFFNGKCITTKTDCTDYNISTVSEANKLTVCSSFRQIKDMTTKKCDYQATTPNTCITLTCENSPSPTSLAGCLNTYQCIYYANKCYTKIACADYTFPDSVNTPELKRLFCQNMMDSSLDKFCSFDSTLNGGGGGCAAYKKCTAIDGTSLEECKIARDEDGIVCTWSSGAKCSLAADAAVCTTVTGALSDYDCQIRTSAHCLNVSGTCTGKACTEYDGNNPADCQVFREAGGAYCTWESGDKCKTAVANCRDLSGAAYNSIAACTPFIDKEGRKCSWLTGTTCDYYFCYDVVDAKSQADCNLVGFGCTFFRGYCIMQGTECNAMVAHGVDAAAKLTYCNMRKNFNSEKCTYIAGPHCVNQGACSNYEVSSLTEKADKLTNCKNSATTDASGCTYFFGDTCTKIQDTCAGYSSYTDADADVYCLDYKTSTGLQCIGVAAATACSSPANCGAITSPTNQASCDLYVSGCIFYSNSCITLNTCENYTVAAGTTAISYCKGIKDTAGNYCTATADGDSTCTTRACNDTETLYFTTHAECKAYSNLCKSDGFGCIDLSTGCTSQSGILSLKTCNALLDADGNNCSVATASLLAKACKIKSCSDNVTATSQGECDQFMTGCRWINPGCTDKTTPCTMYRGTQVECGGFVGNDIKCWSDSPTRGACRPKKCEDKSVAANDTECKTYLDGCVFNGVGCVTKGSSCSSFRGTKDTCSSFDTNSAQACWSISTTVGPCINKQCTHLTSKQDSDCESFLPNNNCITDGTTCIQGPKPCSYFKGNGDTCPLFKSNQGICKKGLNGFCAKRECYEAPNTFTKDSQCSDWSPGCYTNGRGCQSSVTCLDFQNQATCGAANGCQWASSCRAPVTSCSSLTTSGQSVCVNNTAKKCAWYNGVCREPTCVDLDATLTTHELCKAALPTLSCTTTGAGCIAQGVCSSYTTKTVCEAAETTEIEKKCTWVNAQCRVRKCEDFSGTSIEACEQFLPGCKTTGTTCVGEPYGCSVFSGNQKYCLTDSRGNPCLYVEGQCYNYDDCTDASPPTKNYCKSFSSNCVVGTTTCIALNQCSKYKDQTSCYSGINSTVCGWLPSQTCDEFKQCSQATGTTLNECVAWNSSCVSDGAACVPIGDCGSYLKPQSCEGNYDTAGNACFWTGSACRLKQCSDVATGATDADCVMNIVKEGVCTTNGTSCVLRAACSTYSTEAACTVGSDGIPCIFSFPLGTTTGTKSCRPKDCTDIAGTTNDQCVGQINKKNCVSNGKTCVNQGTCASYKNKVSCAAGGSDNSRCVFTAAPTTADPLAGTCQAFTSCASASGDSVTCALNKSCKYTESTKKCETTDCKTFTSTGTCQPIPSFDGKTFTLCTSTANGCTAGDPTTLAQADCYSAVSRYTYTWNTGTSKCQSCKDSSSTINNTNNGNTTTNTTTDSGYVLGVSMALAILGFMA